MGALVSMMAIASHHLKNGTCWSSWGTRNRIHASLGDTVGRVVWTGGEVESEFVHAKPHLTAYYWRGDEG
jgi:hypothetical protein